MNTANTANTPRSRLRSRRARTAAAVALAGGLVALTAPTATAAADGPVTDSPERVAPLVQPSVVYETVKWSGYVYDTYNRTYLRTDAAFTVPTQCTGFVVSSDGYVATAGHCVDPGEGKELVKRAAAEWALSNGYYSDPAGLTPELVMSTYRVDVVDDHGNVARNRADRAVGVSWGASVSGVKVQKSKPARVVAFQKFKEGDGALLKVDETGLNAIELADTSEVAINDAVVAIGYPAVIDSFTDPDLTPTFDSGNVSSIKTIAKGLVKVFQLSAELSGGMSGGPTVDMDGEVVGVNSSHFVGEPFNYAVPVDRIKELMAGAGVENTVSETTQTYRDGIDAFFEGDRTTAVQSLEEVLDEQPANGLAEEYLAKAKDLPKPAPKEDGSFPWLLVGGGAGGVVVLGGAAAAVLATRRRRGASPASVGQPVPSGGAGQPMQAGQPAGPVTGRVDERVPVPAGFASSAPAGTEPGASAGFTAPVNPVGGAVVAVAQRYCSGCGHEADGAFCAHCGTKVVPNR